MISGENSQMILPSAAKFTSLWLVLVCASAVPQATVPTRSPLPIPGVAVTSTGSLVLLIPTIALPILWSADYLVGNLSDPRVQCAVHHVTSSLSGFEANNISVSAVAFWAASGDSATVATTWPRGDELACRLFPGPMNQLEGRQIRQVAVNDTTAGLVPVFLPGFLAVSFAIELRLRLEPLDDAAPARRILEAAVLRFEAGVASSAPLLGPSASSVLASLASEVAGALGISPSAINFTVPVGSFVLTTASLSAGASGSLLPSEIVGKAAAGDFGVAAVAILATTIILVIASVVVVFQREIFVRKKANSKLTAVPPSAVVVHNKAFAALQAAGRGADSGIDLHDSTLFASPPTTASGRDSLRRISAHV